MNRFTWIAVFGVACFVPICLAQRGAGEPEGMARSGDKPPIATITGTLKEVRTHRCEHSTGRSPLGVHLIVNAEDGSTYNLHLGPAGEVDDVLGHVMVGSPIHCQGFRTDLMAPGNFNVVSLESDGQVIELRDETLRPRWAGQNKQRRGPVPGLRGSGRGGPRQERRPARFGDPSGPEAALVLADALALTDSQRTELKALVAETRDRVRRILTEEQARRMEEQAKGIQRRGR